MSWGDLSDFIKHKQQVIERQMEKHTPQPSPQSEMVAVPREVVEQIQKLTKAADEMQKFLASEFSESEFELNAYLGETAASLHVHNYTAKSMLQPYTKGE